MNDREQGDHDRLLDTAAGDESFTGHCPTCGQADQNAETRRANAAEAELREVAGELEKAKGLHEACHIELENLRANVKSLDMEEPLAQQKRLAEATALLTRIVSGELTDKRLLITWLSTTPSPPAEPAPDKCHVCGSTDVDHGAEHMGAVEYPENICESCYRDRAAEPAPSLVEQVQATILDWFDSDMDDAQLAADVLDRVHGIVFRAAREAGGR